MDRPDTTDFPERHPGRKSGRRHLRLAATGLCAGAAGLLGVTGLAPAAGASPARAGQTSALPTTAAARRPQPTEAAACGTRTASAGPTSGSVSPRVPPATSGGSAPTASAGSHGAVRRGNIEGSGASPVLPAGNGPLSDQLFVTAGSTDATLMGNLGHSGPAAGGLRRVPTIHGLSSMATGTGASSTHGPRGRVMKGNIEGSDASPVVPAGNGPLSDQLWVTAGATDATLMGNCGTSGPAAGGLRKTGAGPWGAATRAAAIGPGVPTASPAGKNGG